MLLLPGRLMVQAPLSSDIPPQQAADDTARKLAQTLLHSAPTFFVAIDQGGLVRMMNQTMLDALGYTLDEVVGLDYLSNFVPVEDRAMLDAIFKSLCTQHDPVQNENLVMSKSGKQLLIEWHGRPMFGDNGVFQYFYGIGIDVTQRRAVQDALKRSEEDSRRILECVPGGIVMVGNDGRILKSNSEGQRFLGLTYDTLTKLYVADFRNRTIREDGTQFDVADYPVSKALSTGQPQPPVTIGVEKPDGNVNWGLFSAIPTFDALTGKATGAVVTFIDITQRRREERERLALERKLLEAQRLESIGILAGGIAHDFNNLLAGILGNANLATMQTPPDSPIRPFLQSIESTSQVAARLCAQMLAYAGRGRTLVQLTNVNAVIEEMNKLLSIFVGERIELLLQLGAPTAQVIADATQIRQVLLNLVINASEAIGEQSGTIRVVTGTILANRDDLKQTHLAPDLEPGQYLFIDVIDTGCGMDTLTQGRLFDPFFTTKFTGRGLGLAAVLGILRSHNGAIKVESAPGKGATFRVLLPIANDL